MLKKVNPTNKILVKYLQTVNPDVETGVLLEIEAGSSKPSKKTKSNKSSPKKVEGDEKKKVEENEAQPLKEVVPSKSGILKWIRMKSSKRTSSDDSLMVHKTQVSSKGVVVHEIPAPVSPLSKKRRAHDVAKHITQKRYKRKLVIRDDSSENEVVPDTPIASTSMVTSTPIISSISNVSIISPTPTIPLKEIGNQVFTTYYSLFFITTYYFNFICFLTTTHLNFYIISSV
ncbi:unnamed protein product [Lactuca virosa]|uniref:Uncharacterized protein n=1 Tax=Lactuca virosa TaxID=75947 RepID=A0AAU9MJ45_9ASTR|nr:unnamed protein product [Lactuca virosa]